MARRKVSSPRIADLKTQVATLENLATEAESAKQFGPAVKARSEVAKLRKELALAISEAEADQETDPLARLVRLRRGASEAGSWVAASQLARQEEDLRAKREAEARAVADAAGDGLTDDQVVRQLVEALRALPAAMRDRIISEARTVPTIIDVDLDEEDEDLDP